MSTNKKTTKTINRRTRRVLKRDSELFEAKPSKGSLDGFRVNRRVKKGEAKYEEKPTSRELKIDRKVKS